MRVATFNVQNLRCRADATSFHLDGARNEVLPLSRLSAEDRDLDRRDRALTADLIAAVKPDILALQEVFDIETLRSFHDACLVPRGAVFPFLTCVPGNDGRRRVAFMSRLPLTDVFSHRELSYADIDIDPPPETSDNEPVFRRDCLIARYQDVWLMNVHFKAPADEHSLAVVSREARAARMIIERRFGSEPWLALGDFNVGDVLAADALAPFAPPFCVDLASRLPASERWTYFHAQSGSYARPDRIIVSPALAQKCLGFEVHRDGLSRAATAYSGARFQGVGEIRPRASDHALLKVDVITSGCI
jgi:endonuclease/exonuclease/phosphatase family metal-dependent hydrolase